MLEIDIMLGHSFDVLLLPAWGTLSLKKNVLKFDFCKFYWHKLLIIVSPPLALNIDDNIWAMCLVLAMYTWVITRLVSPVKCFRNISFDDLSIYHHMAIFLLDIRQII